MVPGIQIATLKNVKAGSFGPVETFASELVQLNARLANVVLIFQSQSFKVFFFYISLFLINSPSERI